MAIVATGFFDGVHSGHRSVISKMAALARERGEKAVVVTFWPHPRTVLQQDADRLRLLNSPEEKRALCLAAGADEYEVLPFSRDFSRLSAAEFIKQYLVDRFGASAIVLGSDHRLGCDGAGSPEEMASIVRFCGLEPVFVDDSVCPDGRAVSSTLIRDALNSGDTAAANAMLGYGYTLRGAVVAGNRIGRTIGFPTANMELYDPLKLVPARGVYCVEVEVQGGHYRGICNIGVRPTVGDNRGRTIETHILDFDEDIYGLDIAVTFGSRIRDERHFESLEALKAQLEQDKISANLLSLRNF